MNDSSVSKEELNEMFHFALMLDMVLELDGALEEWHTWVQVMMVNSSL